MDHHTAHVAMALADMTRYDEQTGHRLTIDVIDMAAKIGAAPEAHTPAQARSQKPTLATAASYPTPRQADEHTAPDREPGLWQGARGPVPRAATRPPSRGRTSGSEDLRHCIPEQNSR